MGTLVEKINYLKETKTAIKNAIVAKGVSVSDTDTFRSYAGKIGEIQSGSSGGGSENNAIIDFTKYTDGTFIYKMISSIDLSSFDTSSVTRMSNMFSNLSSLQSLDLSSFVTSKVTRMDSMFNNCSKLQTLILGNNWASHTKITSFNLSTCTALSHDSLVDIMNKLATRTNSPTIKLSTESKNLLTTSEKAIATGKGWTIA